MAHWINVENYLYDDTLYGDISICSECNAGIIHGFLSDKCPKCGASINRAETEYIKFYDGNGNNK